MGLFDKILPSPIKSFALTEPEAFFAILLVTTLVDGELSDEECDDLVTMSSRMNLFKDLTGDDIHKIITKVLDPANKLTVEALLQKCSAQLSSELRETAFVKAADLIFSDGYIDENEKALLELIQTHLGIPENLALAAISILQIKNRG